MTDLPDRDNPEWTKDDVRRAKRVSDLPESLQRKLRARGPQKEAVKERITIRLDADVVAYFRATGKGWQSRLNEALKKEIKKRA